MRGKSLVELILKIFNNVYGFGTCSPERVLDIGQVRTMS